MIIYIDGTMQSSQNGFLKSLSAGMEAGEFKQLDTETIAYCLMSIGQFLGMRWGYWERKMFQKMYLKQRCH